MSESTLRTLIAGVLVVGLVAVIASILVLTSRGAFRSDQQKLLLLIVTPLIAPSAMDAVKYHLPRRLLSAAPPLKGPSERATVAQIIFGLGTVTVFPLALILIIVAKAYNVGIRSFDDLLTTIAVVDGAFAIIMTANREHFFPQK